MKIVPFKNFLCKPLELQTGNFYPERIVDRAIENYEKQFEPLQKENEELKKQLTWIPMSSDEKPEFNQLVMAWDAKLEKVDSYKYPGFFPLRYTHWLPIPDINNK